MPESLTFKLSLFVNILDIFQATEVSLLPRVTQVLLAECGLPHADFLPQKLVVWQRLPLDRESVTESPTETSLDIVQLTSIQEFKNLLIIVFAKLHKRMERHILWVYFHLINQCLKQIF